ncbi:hypothetical protein [Staphylococcus caprae]|uniref:hypothetical protein n=1 Tax=Staphylococcus caprae TaxID=29380 RepID=UPI000CD13C5C|nr:hypothetical protein [Staphylococcus caprae]POA04168.1 hypothetical protein CD155_07865 [Staphylococcus caprae]SUL89538.1 Uncharacterised protein [Staphylococcus caprae]
MFLLEFNQFSTRKVVGLFKTVDDIKSWINSIDNIKVYRENIDGVIFKDYVLDYKELPSYLEIKWRDSKFILSKYMFSPDEGDIVLTWEKLDVLSEIEGVVSGQSKIGAYVISNEDLEYYIKSLEDMKKYLINYFENKNHNVKISGQGSEDGEYLLVDDRFVCHLEDSIVEKWQKKKSKKHFIEYLKCDDIF